MPKIKPDHNCSVCLYGEFEPQKKSGFCIYGNKGVTVENSCKKNFRERISINGKK